MTISTLAKQRAFERYSVRFSKKRWKSFERTLRNPKFAIRLTGERLVCYFEKQWFFMVCMANGVVLTFLSPEDASDKDKQILRQDERYRRINVDTFRVLLRVSLSILDISSVESSVDLPTTLTEEELPPEVLKTAEKWMKKECKQGQIRAMRNISTSRQE